MENVCEFRFIRTLLTHVHQALRGGARMATITVVSVLARPMAESRGEE